MSFDPHFGLYQKYRKRKGTRLATSRGPTMSVRALPSGADPRTVEFEIAGRIDPVDVPTLCDYVCARLQSEPPDRVICDLGAVIDSGAVAVDALARLQLASRRRGCSIELRNPSPQLLELLELVGLTGVMPTVGA